MLILGAGERELKSFPENMQRYKTKLIKHTSVSFFY